MCTWQPVRLPSAYSVTVRAIAYISSLYDEYRQCLGPRINDSYSNEKSIYVKYFKWDLLLILQESYKIMLIVGRKCPITVYK